MISATKNKNIITVVAIILMAGILFGFFADSVLAGPTAVKSPAGKASTFAGAAATVGSIVSGAITIYALLYATFLISGYVVTILAELLDKIFTYNIGWVPATMPAVVTGWTIMRDMVNALFILIVLWIAFTIIFNQEQWGGKKLLVRVIIIALTINFSLALVSAVFQIANTLAAPFAQKIDGGKLGSLIIANTSIQTVAKQVSETDLATLKKQEEQISLSDNIRSKSPSVGQYLGAQDAKAIEASQVAGICAIGTFIPVVSPFAAACAVGATAYSLLQSFLGTGSSGPLEGFSGLVVGTLLLIIMAFALATACIIIFARVVAMSFLAVLAPAAFLAFMLPGKIGQKYWNMWLENLIKWAFYAPAFYFLLYLALLMLQQMTAKLITSTIFDMERIFVLLLFVGFLLGAVKLAKWMGITVADGFVNLGSKLAWGAVGGAAGLAWGATRGAATRWGGAAAQKAESSEAYEKASRYVPFSGVIRKGLQKAAATERGAIKKTEGQLDEFTSRELQSRYSDASTYGTERAAIMKILAKRRDIEPQPGVKTWGDTQLKQGMDHFARTGDHDSILSVLKVRPDLTKTSYVPGTSTDAEAIVKVVKEMDDRSKIKKETLQSQPLIRDAVINAVWLNTNTNELSKIARENQALMKEMQDYISDPVYGASLSHAMDPLKAAQFRNYLAGTLKKSKSGGRVYGGAVYGWDKGYL